MDNRKGSVSGSHSTNSLQPLIPHMPTPPKEECPFSAQQSLGCPTSVLECIDFLLQHHIVGLYEETTDRLPFVDLEELWVWNHSLLFLLLKSAQFHSSRGGTGTSGFSSCDM
jgi:hypothetical protein